MADFLTGNRHAARIGYAAGIAQGGLTASQSFRTFPVPNFQTALYGLQIRDPGGGLVYNFIFPLSPESIRKEFNALTNTYDIAGPAFSQGVTRQSDLYGNCPPVFVIEGTTGWKLHSADGYQFTGLQAARQLEELISIHAQLNQEQIASGNPGIYEMWFFDFFRGDFWSVLPTGPQGIRQSQARTLYVMYAFRLSAIYRLDTPFGQLPDDLVSTLAATDNQAAGDLKSFGDKYSTNYGDTTPPVGS